MIPGGINIDNSCLGNWRDRSNDQGLKQTIAPWLPLSEVEVTVCSGSWDWMRQEEDREEETEVRKAKNEGGIGNMKSLWIIDSQMKMKC